MSADITGHVRDAYWVWENESETEICLQTKHRISARKRKKTSVTFWYGKMCFDILYFSLSERTHIHKDDVGLHASRCQFFFTSMRYYIVGKYFTHTHINILSSVCILEIAWSKCAIYMLVVGIIVTHIAFIYIHVYIMKLWAMNNFVPHHVSCASVCGAASTSSSIFRVVILSV